MQQLPLNSARLVILALALAAASSVRSAEEGVYLHADLGASFVQNITPSDSDLGRFTLASGRSLQLDPGLRFSLGPGYTLYSSPAMESAVQFETGLIWNSVNGGGDFYQVPFLVDIIYGFHIGERFTPYIGIGGGGVYGSLQGLRGPDGDFSETDGAFQVMAGLRFKICDQSELGVGYKFLATFPDSTDYIGTHAVSVAYTVHFK